MPAEHPHTSDSPHTKAGMGRSISTIQELDKVSFEQHLAQLLSEDTTPTALRAAHGMLHGFNGPPIRKESAGVQYSVVGSPAGDGSSDKREYVLRELRETEELFVLDLKLILAAFVVPLCEHARLPSVQGVSYAVQVLFTFQHRFLRALERGRSVRSVAKLFTSERHGFEAYIEYCTKYHKMCDILDALEADAGWTGFLAQVQEQIDGHSGRRRLALRDFLIKPVQRICKYPLFLQDLIKHTDREAEPETFRALERALESVRNVCMRIDNEQRRTEALKLRRVLLGNYCDNAELPLSLVVKLGSIVLSGPLRITSHEDRMAAGPPRGFGCVLFRRFLIVLRVKKAVVPKYWFPLHTMQLVDEPSEHVFSWRLQHTKSQQCMVFYARCHEEKALWVSRLTSAIGEARRRLRVRLGRRCSVDDPGISENLQASASAGSSPTAPMASGSLGNARAFWHQSSLVREDPVEKQFERMTTPDIIRLVVAARLRHMPDDPPRVSNARAVTIKRKPTGRAPSRASSSASEDTAVSESLQADSQEYGASHTMPGEG
ncbi:hypothetical protein EC988_004888, partial [Linderina pennispora]